MATEYSKEEQIAINLVLNPPDRELTRYEKDVLSSVANQLGMTSTQYRSYVQANASTLEPQAWAYTTQPATDVWQTTPAEVDAEYRRYLEFLKTAEGQGYPVPKDIADYYRIKAEWGKQEQPPITPEPEQQPITPEQDEFALTPEEAARRREEAYAESRYAAEERYHEAPRYQETFSKWIQGQGNVSGALQQYIQSKYPSLRAEFESGISREVGFPTREEARTEASQREAGWQSWLSQRMPETRQDYWGQRPSDRGERYYMYAPTTKTVNW